MTLGVTPKPVLDKAFHASALRMSGTSTILILRRILDCGRECARHLFQRHQPQPLRSRANGRQQLPPAFGWSDILDEIRIVRKSAFCDTTPQ